MKYLIGLILIILSGIGAYPGVIPAVVKIYDESEIKEYEEAGVIIERRRGDILLCYFPESDDDIIVIPNAGNPDREAESDTKTRGMDDDRAVKKTSAKGRRFIDPRGRINKPTLDEAVRFFNASDIQSGKGFESGYSGKGIVVGLCDIGFDPLHPTFLDDNGKSRVKRITHYKEYEGIRSVIEGDEAYKEWKTDTLEENHATHVAGILAGGGARSPYRGIAYDADIVASVCQLTDFGLLMGVEDIIDYAKEVGKPAVINLSMGNYTGAHDGTSLFSQYLDMCADDAIIVLSAGNAGNQTNTLSYKFEKSDKVEFRLGNSAWDQKKMYGITDIWNVTDRPVKVSIGIYDDENYRKVHEFESHLLRDWETVKYEWDPDNPVLPDLTLDGYLMLTGGIDPENGRYELAILYDYESSRLVGSGWAKDVVYVKIEGENGDEIDVFADGSYTRLMGVQGSPDPNSGMSISDLVCGHRVVSVGMYANRSSVPVNKLNSQGDITGFELKAEGREPLQTVIYSSYGTLRDGRQLPLTVAPGNRLVSSYSRPYRDVHPLESYYLDENGVPWIAMGGTSMASPYVAGYIATWLQAIPGLTPENVLEMIAKSNTHDIPDPENPRNINGYFNPVKALRFALENNGIDQIVDPSYVLLPDDLVDIFNLSGMKVYSGYAAGADSLQKGIYIIKTKFGVTKKVLPGLF